MSNNWAWFTSIRDISISYSEVTILDLNDVTRHVNQKGAHLIRIEFCHLKWSRDFSLQLPRRIRVSYKQWGMFDSHSEMRYEIQMFHSSSLLDLWNNWGEKSRSHKVRWENYIGIRVESNGWAYYTSGVRWVTRLEWGDLPFDLLGDSLHPSRVLLPRYARPRSFTLFHF